MTDDRHGARAGSDPDLDELLELAARLAPPDEDDRVWQRSTSGALDRFSHMLRHVAAGSSQEVAERPSIGGGRAGCPQPEPLHAAHSDVDGADGLDRPQDLDDSTDGAPTGVPGDVLGGGVDTTAEDAPAEAPCRALIPVPEATIGWRIRDPFATIPPRWRRPAGIGSAVAAAGLVLGVGLHTVGPAIGFTPYTPAPVTAGGSPQSTYQSIPIYSLPAISTAPPSVANPLSIVPVSSPPARSGSSASTPAPTAAPVTVVIPVRTPNPAPAPTAPPTTSPTAAPTPSLTPTPPTTPVPTPKPTASPTPTATPVPPSPTPSSSPTASPSPSPSETAAPTP
jgi:hypothetical protein